MSPVCKSIEEVRLLETNKASETCSPSLYEEVGQSSLTGG